MEPYDDQRPGRLREEQLDDVPAVVALLVEHRDHPDALASALRLLDALDDQLALCPREAWSAWAAVAEAAEEALRRIERAQRERLGLRRAQLCGEAGAAPARPAPPVEMVRGTRGPCPTTPRPPVCGGRRRRSST